MVNNNKEIAVVLLTNSRYSFENRSGHASTMIYSNAIGEAINIKLLYCQDSLNLPFSKACKARWLPQPGQLSPVNALNGQRRSGWVVGS